MRNIIWLIVLPLAACASVQQNQEVYIAPPLNAPVQIVSITPYRNNLRPSAPEVPAASLPPLLL